MMKLLKKLRNSKRGFSLVELIVVIAIMAVLTAILAPALLSYVERSRAEKDIKTTDEVVTAVELALAGQDVYDELVEHSVFDNVSCYVDKDSESGYEKTVIKETYNEHAEQYMFGDDARQNDEVPYYGAGNMRGLTITFSPEKDSNESRYELSRGIINRFVGRKTGYLYENEKLYNAIRSVVGDKIYNSSQTYRNSDFTIFIRLGSAGGNEAGNQDATQVWGQYNGTNLPADAIQTAKITTDRAIGDAGQYDITVNNYINDESNADISFSETANMGTSNFGEELESNEMITFNVGEQEYTAKKGMTWANWLMSYNPLSSSCNGIIWVGLDNQTIYLDNGCNHASISDSRALYLYEDFRYAEKQTVGSVIKDGADYKTLGLDGCCFDAGSQVLMADGTTKNIEDVKIGDMVMSLNEDTNEFVTQRVENTIIKHNSDDLVYVNLSNGVQIGMRAYHPLLTVDGWKSLRPQFAETITDVGHVELLKVGDVLVGYEDNAKIVSIETRDDIDNYDTFNLTIEGYHNYIVNGMVVHNAGCK